MSIVGAITAVIFTACDSIVFQQAHFSFVNDLVPATKAGIVAACQQARLRPETGDRSCSSRVRGLSFLRPDPLLAIDRQRIGRRNV